MGMQYREADGAVTLSINEKFDFNLHKEFRKQIENALGSSCGQIRVDLSLAEYIDSSALGMLLMLKEKADAGAKAVKLVGVRGTNRQILEIARFDKLFDVEFA